MKSVNSSRTLSRFWLATSVWVKPNTSDGEMVFPNQLLRTSVVSLPFYFSLNHRSCIAAPVIKGQWDVNPTSVILGYKGDPVYDDRTALARPTFTKDGSFMVFRKLEQNILYLEDYINQNWRTIDQGINNIQLTEAQRKAHGCLAVSSRWGTLLPSWYSKCWLSP